MKGKLRLAFLATLTVPLVYLMWVVTHKYENVREHQHPPTSKRITFRRDYLDKLTGPEGDSNKSCDFENYILGQPTNQADPCLVATFRKKMLVFPRPSEARKTVPFSRTEVDVPSNIEKLKWVQMLVMEGSPKDTQFFFVESGALDGRLLSTTLRLETIFGWNGVLIEPQPREFQELLKIRKVWAVNAALCVTPHPEYMDFYTNQDFTAMSGFTERKRKKQVKVKLPCVPLYTILKAINVTVVDYLSLDIEGAELLVLQTIPFNKVMFKIMTIEYNHLPGENQIGQLENFLKPRGYKLVANITGMDKWSEDCLFVHESVYQEKKLMIRNLINI